MGDCDTMSIDLFVNNNKKRVLLRGPFLTQSGYGVHARQIAQWAFSRNDFDVEVQTLPWGDTPWIIDHKFSNGLVGKIMEKTVDPTGRQYDMSVQLQLPNEWDNNLAKKNIGITAAVETDKCNPEWVHASNLMDCVVFPSKHALNSIKNSGTISSKTFVIPESFSNDFHSNKITNTKIDDIKWNTNFNFLIVGQITGNNPENDRKNIFYTIKWFCETFKDDPDVGLVIKTNLGRNTTIDRKITQNMLTALLKEVRKDNKFPAIHLLHGHMSDQEMASLYRHPQIKCLLSLSRGEGFGLPILEAAVCELPVIATGWSGYTDFLKSGKYVEVGYSLSKIDPSRVDNVIFVPQSKWAQPSEEDAKKKMLKFRQQSTIPQEWAKNLGEILVKTHNSNEINKQYDTVVEEIYK